MINYSLPGDQAYQERLYPDPKLLDPKINLKTYEDVIKRFTGSSLSQDGILIKDGSLNVVRGAGGYTVSFSQKSAHVAAANQFAAMHQKMLDEKHCDSRSKAPTPARRPPHGTQWPATRWAITAATEYGSRACRSACPWSTIKR